MSSYCRGAPFSLALHSEGEWSLKGERGLFKGGGV